MRSLVALTLLFIAVVAINSIAVYSQRRFKFYTRLFGKYDWAAHVLLLTIIWVGFLLAVVVAKPASWSLPSILRPLGIVAAAVGTWLVFESWIRLGTAAVFNGWFFGRGSTKQLKGGVFKLRNPMYVGFVLLFVSAAFWLKNAAYLWLAATSFVLLNLIQSRIERPTTKDDFKKELKICGVGLLNPKTIASLFVIAVLVAALAIYSLRSPIIMSSKNMSMSDMGVQTTTAMKQMFIKLAAAHTDVCGDIGNKLAIDKYMSGLPSGSRLQGSCCSPMDMKKYVSQINGLKKYINIPQIPQNPYNVSVTSAKQMLGFYNTQLTPAQQAIYDKAQSMTADKGWCCCQCWAWYAHAGLAKYLITQHSFNTEQIVAVTNLEDCCGGT